MLSTRHRLTSSLVLSFALSAFQSFAQQPSTDSTQQPTATERILLERIEKLEQRVAELEKKQTDAPQPVATAQTSAAQQTPSQPAEPSALAPSASGIDSALALADGTTLNFDLDGYFGYSFNHPLGRVNLLRFNDPSSDSFSLSQAVFMVEREPDTSLNRPFGYRVDLMFGQDTETLQGNAANEPRPWVYRNVFQAYGSYVFPVGHGLQVDFGKFSSSLGIEGTYTKDQLNYSRSYLYGFLPFYHMGARVTYNVSNELSLQYWLVNGANQAEDFNGFKSQAAIVTVKPDRRISWNINYYEGQEQRDIVPLYGVLIPVLATQPGLSIEPVTIPHNGREHIIDSYITLNLSQKWSAALEGDYVLSRIASTSPPQRVYAGAAYLHHQLTTALSLNGRFEYLSDRDGLFSGTDQILKEVTTTAIYQFMNGFETRLEYRRDFSNRPFFLTNNPLIFSRFQNTATIGLLWWFGGKQGNW